MQQARVVLLGASNLTLGLGTALAKRYGLCWFEARAEWFGVDPMPGRQSAVGYLAWNGMPSSWGSTAVGLGFICIEGGVALSVR